MSRLLAGLTLLLALATPARAQEPASELLLVHGEAATPADLRRAQRLLTLQGAGRFEIDELTPWTEFVPTDGLGGAAPRVGCAPGSTLRAAASLEAELDTARSAIEFGRNEVAIDALTAVAAALPCAGEPLTDELLARLWFLTGAVGFLEGRADLSRAGFSRTILADTSVAFDDLFPATVHDALLSAKEEVLERPRARVVTWTGAEVRLDGRLVPVEDGVGRVQARVGPRLVQVTEGGRTRSVLVDLSAVPVVDGVATLVVVDAAGLDRALRVLSRDEDPWLAEARAAVLALLAERGEPYGTLVASRADRPRDERPLTALDVVTASTGPYRARTSRADAFGRRARISLAPFYRALDRPGESALHYGGLEAVGWVPVHWLVRAGFGVRWAVTPRRPPEGKALCCSTLEISPRVRLERGAGSVRPFGELGFLLFWPAARTEAAPPGPLDVAAGFDLGGGLLLTPGEARRVGLGIAGFGGAIAGLGPMASLRLSVELRF